MVLGHGHRKNSLASNRSSTDEPRDSDTGEDVEVVDAEQGNVLTHIISQLRPGADLSRVTLPTFILEPRSMLERITNFMAHPETLLTIPEIDDPVQRFVAVTKFYLAGWHIKPPGVKKPLNPILGETFTGYWDYPDGTHGYYISEQTSHHPPKSSYFWMAPEHRIRIDGTLKPRSKFLGNSVGSFMEGIAIMRFLNRKERYFITQPNMYARGILFGKMRYELGDHAVLRCPETGLEADIEFKVKGWIGGTYNAIGGFIKDSKSGKQLYEVSGMWNEQMHIKDLGTGKKELFFDASHAKPSMVQARPISEQAPRESQRLWDSTVKAIKKADQKTATDEKSRIEDEQRREATERGEDEWQPKLFKPAPPGDEQSLDWIINAQVDDDAPAEKQTKQILAIAPILPGQEQSKQFLEDEKLPPQQGKSIPQQQRVQKEQGGADLIDFGQHDGGSSAVPGQAVNNAKSGSEDMMAGMGSMSIQGQQGNGSNSAANAGRPQAQQSGEWKPNRPVVRMNSVGKEETFMDAES